ncbi:MAG: hypothetical protein Q7R95_02020 [bacterium]|nr:hypothetical protein [bacterium]
MNSLPSGWDKVVKVDDQKRSNKKKNVDLWVDLSKRRIVRLIGDPISFRSIYYNNRYYTVPLEYVQKVIDAGFKYPSYNYAINAFDREDTKNNITRIRILKGGPRIFGAFKLYYDTTSNHPGKNDGPEFAIDPSEKELEDGRKIRDYTVMPLEKIKFTKKEIEFISLKLTKEECKGKSLGEFGLIDLQGFYGSKKNIQRIEELLLNPPNQKNQNNATDSSDNSDDNDEKDNKPDGDNSIDDLLTSSSSKEQINDSSIDESTDITDEDLQAILDRMP